MDLFSQYKKQSNESANSTSKSHTHSSSNKDLSSSQRATSSPTSSSNNSKQQQQFATKIPSEKSPAASFLKEALLIGSSAPKLSTSPLAVDNMLNKSHNSPKTNTKPSTTIHNPLPNTQRSSVSNKSDTNRPSTDLTPHRTDQQQKSSSSSNRSQSNRASPSSISPASRRSTTGFTPTHDQQVNVNSFEMFNSYSLLDKSYN
jgi:hypothetical protein